MTAAPAQLVLRLLPPQAASTPGTETLPNAAQAEARMWLDKPQAWPLGRLALHGAPGTGKSHLAHAWAAGIGGTVLDAAPTGGWPDHPIAIDTVDTVPDEPALLYLLNASAESRHPVLLVSRLPPGRLPVRLPDLASRLRATTAVQLGQPDDVFLAMLLARLLADRQLRLPAALQSWLLARLPRTAAALQDAVTCLDAAALSAGRAITRPLAAAVLGLHDSSAELAPTPSPFTREPR